MTADKVELSERAGVEGHARIRRAVATALCLAGATALAVAFLTNQPKPVPLAPMPVAAAPEPAAANPSTIAYIDKDSGWLVVWAAEGDAKSSG